jgi:hypothetical protein
MGKIAQEELKRIRELSKLELQSALIPTVVYRNPSYWIDFQVSDIPTGFVLFEIDSLRVKGQGKTILIADFYPHFKTADLERIGLGTLTLLKGLNLILEEGQASQQHLVFYHPKVTLDAKKFFKRLGVFSEGLDLKEYYNLAADYARSNGFSFNNI